MDSSFESTTLRPSARGEVSLSLAMKRGLLGRCPNCGRTALFGSYLEQIPFCPLCGADFRRIRADDAAPWLTLIIVGHFFLPAILFVDLSAFMPFWLGVAVWVLLLSGAALALLPRAKGLFIAILWVTHAPGADNG
jgi:uncharacterized protein (DUF983 family)